MTHRLSFIVLGGSGSKIKQIHFSKKQFIAMAAIAFAVIAVTVYGVVNYFSLHSQLVNQKFLKQRLAVQSEEVLHQRQQIQKFAGEINHLKESLVALYKFRDQIRVVANIDQPDTQDGLFGVGGAAPEDLAPNNHLTQSQAPLMKKMHQQISQLEDASQKQETLFNILLDRLEEQKNLLSHTPAIQPARGWVTSKFSYRQSPFTGKREFHKGIDIANKGGTTIVAAADGVVSFAGPKGSFGQIVVIDHGYGFVTRYAHIEKWLKEKGERVRRGEAIALMGSTGRSTGPHLHYEVHLNGVPVNPEKYILN